MNVNEIVYASRIPPGLSFAGSWAPRTTLWLHFGGELGALWGSVGSPFGVPEANPTHRRPEGPSRTPRELSTPTVYNAHVALEPLLLLRKFEDFIVLLKNRIVKTSISLSTYVELAPIRRARARLEKHQNAPATAVKKRSAQIENVVFYLSKIYVFKVPRRSGAFS